MIYIWQRKELVMLTSLADYCIDYPLIVVETHIKGELDIPLLQVFVCSVFHNDIHTCLRRR